MRVFMSLEEEDRMVPIESRRQRQWRSVLGMKQRSSDTLVTVEDVQIKPGTSMVMNLLINLKQGSVNDSSMKSQPE